MLIQMPLFRLAPDADQVVQYHQKNMGAELRCEVNYLFFGQKSWVLMKKTAVFNRQLQPGPALHILLSFAVIININDQN